MMSAVSSIRSQSLSESGDIPRLSLFVVIRLSGLFLLSRALIMTVAAVSRLMVQPGPYAFHSMSHSWTDRFLVWDSMWYVDIAKLGYYYDPKGPSSIGFYPLLPMMLRAMSMLGVDPVLAGYLISHLALAGACVLCWKLAALELRSAAAADRTVTFMLFCPGAVWFGMIYTESLFILTVFGCLLAARQGRWVVAGFWGMAAALTRTPGVLLAGFLFLEAIQQWVETRRSSRDDGETSLLPSRKALPGGPIVAMAGPILGQLGFLIFQQVHFGDWRAQQITVAQGWNPSSIGLPWTVLAEHWRTSKLFYTVLSDSLLLVVTGAGVASFFTLKRASYGALVLALTVLYVSSTTGEALPRYLSTTAPVYMVLSQFAQRAPLIETAVLVFSTALLTLLTALLINGYLII